jgi:hypothetical protein
MQGVAMNYLSPISKQMSFIGTRARTWLLASSELIDTNHNVPITSIFQLLIGSWICEEVFIKDAKQTATVSLASKVHRWLDLEEQTAFSALMNSDAALIFLSAGILRTVGKENPIIESFIQQIASEIQMSKDQDDSEFMQLFATRYLLHKLRLHPDPMHAIAPLRNNIDTNLFQADELEIRTLAGNLATTTAYGQRPPSAEPAFLEQLVVVLPIWMLYYFRQHNLEIGTLILRAMNYLHLKKDKAFQMGLDFVLAQQQLDGRFGLLGPEISRLRSTKQDFGEIFELYLPLTISCLWTVAEAADPNFKLFRDYVKSPGKLPAGLHVSSEAPR